MNNKVNQTNIDEGRKRWAIEEQFVNNRLTWLGFTQTLLFAAYGVALTGKKQSFALDHLNYVLPVIGFITSLLIFVGVLGAILAMYNLRNIYQLEDYFVSFHTTIMGWVCNAGIPATFVFAWAWLMLKTWNYA